MVSGTHTLHREMDTRIGALLSPPRVMEQRELDRLAARRSMEGGPVQAAWRPSVIQGGQRGGPGGEEMGSALPDPRRSGGWRTLRTRAAVRIGLTAAIMAALLVVFAMPRAGADRGPVPDVTHVVQPGDSLWSIAEHHTPATGDVRATAALVRSANEGLSGFLMVGDVIKVPVQRIPGTPSGAPG